MHLTLVLNNSALLRIVPMFTLPYLVAKSRLYTVPTLVELTCFKTVCFSRYYRDVLNNNPKIFRNDTRRYPMLKTAQKSNERRLLTQACIQL